MTNLVGPDAAPDAKPATLQAQDLPSRVGTVLGTSPWITIDQAHINAFADATGDHQWIHIDPVRAAAGPFGTTIAHGFLTLSLLPWMGQHAFVIEGNGMSVNYGLNKVRFMAPVPVGSRLRGEFRLKSVDAIEGGVQVVTEVVVHREGASKPVCVAESLARRFV